MTALYSHPEISQPLLLAFCPGLANTTMRMLCALLASGTFKHASAQPVVAAQLGRASALLATTPFFSPLLQAVGAFRYASSSTGAAAGEKRAASDSTSRAVGKASREQQQKEQSGKRRKQRLVLSGDSRLEALAAALAPPGGGALQLHSTFVGERLR